MNKIIKNSLILMAITLVSGILLGFVYELTKEPIAQQKAQAQEAAYKAVFADMDHTQPCEATEVLLEDATQTFAEDGFENVKVEDVYWACASDGSVLGVVMNITTKEGYGGDINFSIGISNDGVLQGLEILSISETPGLGMKANEAEFKEQFKGKKADVLSYTKEGAASDTEIDAISGATMTTKAMTKAVNAGISFYKSLVEGGILNEQ